MTASIAPQLNRNPTIGRFGWLVCETWVVNSGAIPEMACALITASPETPELAALAMPHLATAIGLASWRGAHTEFPDGAYVAFAGRHLILQLGDVLELRRPVDARWRQAAMAESWVRLIVSYLVMPPDAGAASFLRKAVYDGATATVPVLHPGGVAPLDDRR